jgi:hypothetical protein
MATPFVRYEPDGDIDAADVIERIMLLSIFRIDEAVQLPFYPIAIDQYNRGRTMLFDTIEPLLLMVPSHQMAKDIRDFRSATGVELALANRIKCGYCYNPTERYIPFANLRIPLDEHTEERLLREAKMPDMPFKELYFLTSGNSLHVYGDCLVDEDTYRKFLGTLLLWQYRDENQTLSDIADHRWIGHSLIRGISMIRVHERPEERQREYRPRPTLRWTIEV